MGFKMKGHALPGPNQRKSPAKDTRPHTGMNPPHTAASHGGGGRTPPPNPRPTPPPRQPTPPATPVPQPSDWTDKAEKIHKKMDKPKGKGKTVKDSAKMRRLQNRLNKELGSDVRHRKNIFTGGKYKKITKK